MIPADISQEDHKPFWLPNFWERTSVGLFGSAIPILAVALFSIVLTLLNFNTPDRSGFGFVGWLLLNGNAWLWGVPIGFKIASDILFRQVNEGRPGYFRIISRVGWLVFLGAIGIQLGSCWLFQFRDRLAGP